MKLIGFEEVPIDMITVPDNWEAIKASAGAAEIAESANRIGILHEPIVRKQPGDLKLIAGRHRVAAQELRGATSVFCKVIECTDEEEELITAEENTQRWHDPAKRADIQRELIKKYTRLFTVRPDLAPPDPPPKKRGKAQLTPASKANAVVAKLTGQKPATVRQRSWRERKKAQVTEPPPGVRVPSIQTFGIACIDEYLDGIDTIRGHLLAAWDLCKRAQAELTKLEGKDLYPKGRLSALKSQVHDVTALVGEAVPVSLCGYCKGLPGVTEDCAACLRSGFMGADAIERVPAELMDETAPMVRVQGKLVSVDEMLGDPLAELEEAAP